MTARIYRPSKTAMQSGRAKTKGWILELSSDAKRSADPVMGWTSVNDTDSQVRLEFDSREKAIAYAKREGLEFVVVEPRDIQTAREILCGKLRDKPQTALDALTPNNGPVAQLDRAPDF